MKHRTFTLFLILLLISSIAWSQSYFSQLNGDLPFITNARTVAVGFSSWGDAGSASALLSNPALLTLKEQKASFIAGISGYSTKEKRSFPVQDSYGDFLADNSYVINQNWYPDFHLGFNYNMFTNLNLAVMIFHSNIGDFQYEEEVRGSLYGEYNRDPVVGYNLLSSQYSVFNTSAGFSCEMFRVLRFGAGLQLMMTDKAEDSYNIQVLDEGSDYLVSDHTIFYKNKPKIDPIITGNIGLNVDLTKHFNLSASYRFPYEISQKGGLIYLLNDSTQTLPVFEVDSTYTVSSMSRRRPGEIRLGLEIRPVNIIPTKLFFELVYQNWEDASVKYTFKNDADLSGIPTDFYNSQISYRNIMKVHVGLEHVFFSGVPFRAGFYHEPNPIDAGMDRNWFTAGTGYRWDKLSLDISGAFTTTEYEYHDLFPVAAEERVEFDTVRENYMVGTVTLKYAL